MNRFRKAYIEANFKTGVRIHTETKVIITKQKERVMKKLLTVAFGMLFVVSFAFGQNTATINQFGSNIGQITQTGQDNAGTVNQGSASSHVNNDYVPSYSGGYIEGAYIEQTGGNNEADIDVNASGVGSGIFQEGDWNDGSQVLNKGAKVGGHLAITIDQLGDYNVGAQETHGAFGVVGIHHMMIDQDGDNNVATQFSRGGWGSSMEVIQNGNNNNNPSFSGNVFDLSATGLVNPITGIVWVHKPVGDFTQYQNGLKATSYMNIQGNGNNAAQYSEFVNSGGDPGKNDAYLNITGDDNNVGQGQIGRYSSSDINITGNSNVVSTLQAANSNTSMITLIGDDNVAATQQMSEGNSATIHQVGSGNTGLIIQQP